jgi:amino acid transporter
MKSAGRTGEFYAPVSVLVTATYAFLGTELICVTFGEASNPRHTIPRAIKLTFFRIVIFYVGPFFSFPSQAQDDIPYTNFL